MDAKAPIETAARGPLIMSTLETGNDMEFNACVGTNTGSHDNTIGYAGGFEKAAEMLLASLGVPKPAISPQSWGQEPLVDMLVYPICFCARHHIELSIKRMLPLAWRAYTTTFPQNQQQLNPPRQRDVRHDVMAVWADLVTISTAVDRRFDKLCRELGPYIEDLSRIDSTGQVFRYDTDINTSTLNLEDTSHIDVAHFAAGYAQMCMILVDFENLVISIHSALATGSFTSKLSREQLLEVAKALPDRSQWGESEFVQVKQKIMEKYELSGTDFKKATNLIQSSRWLSFRVGIEKRIQHLDKEVLEHLHQVDRRHRDSAATLTEEARSALYGLYETGSIFAYPEEFESHITPRPLEPEAAHYFDLAREEGYLARKYAGSPDRIEHALKQLGQFALLADFQRIYAGEIERLRAARAATDQMDVSQIIIRPRFVDPTEEG